jgi:hypothetical protein
VCLVGERPRACERLLLNFLSCVWIFGESNLKAYFASTSAGCAYAKVVVVVVVVVVTMAVLVCIEL